MSMSSIINIGVNGLNAQSDYLTNIANNVTNVDTTGYKATTTSFADLVNGTTSGATVSGNATGTGSGVTATSHSSLSTQGSITTTSSSLDVAISGSGLFQVQSADQTTSPGTYYTRDGQFQVATASGKSGLYLQTESGMLVDGTAANGSGSASPIEISSYGIMPQQATTSATLTADVSSTTGAVSMSFSMTDYGTDSIPSDQASQQSYLTSYQAANGSGSLPTATTSTVTGTLARDSSGNWTITANGTTESVTPGTSFTIPGTSVTTTLSQSVASSNTNSVAVSANGSARGSGASYSINSSGDVVASYSNGKSQVLANIPVFTAANVNGMSETSGGLYQATTASGTMTQQALAGSGAASATGSTLGTTLDTSSLESSNTDLATELTNMIVAQRAYSAASKIVTTADSMMSTLFQTR
ncbi:MAG: flagellar hook-basal body complex protein [Azospirillaceae bacterium]|nr:flagellar hook-basal body complex protein [Azospirillaceae bacterium]